MLNIDVLYVMFQKRVGKAKAPFKRAEYFVNESYRTGMNEKRMSRLKHQVRSMLFPHSLSK